MFLSFLKSTKSLPACPSDHAFSVSGTMCFGATGTSSAARQGPAVNEHAVSSYQVYCGSNTTTQDDTAVINLHTMGDLA